MSANDVFLIQFEKILRLINLSQTNLCSCRNVSTIWYHYSETQKENMQRSDYTNAESAQ